MTLLLRELERLRIGAASLTAERRVIAANEVFAATLQAAPDALAGLEIAEALSAAAAKTSADGPAHAYCFARDGSVSWYRLDLMASGDTLLALLIDVSAERKALDETRNFYAVRDRLLLDGKIGTWRFDPDAEVYYFSSELSLGHENSTAPVPVTLLQLIQHPDDKAKDSEIRERITREGGSANAEMRYREADGRWTHLGVHYRSGRRLASGRYEMFGVSQNITAVATARDEAHQISGRLAQALQAAEFANRTKTEFLANMSHELRTPLNAILGFSEMIERRMAGPIGAKYTEYAHDIHRSGTLLLELVNDVLDLAKLEAGKLELRESELALTELVDECLTLVRGRADAGCVQLERDLSRAVPILRADARAVKQLLLNFLSNAVKFTPVGGCVTVRTARDAQGRVCLSVSDTGIGMSAAEIQIALSPFGQIDSKLARKHEGTGLGLPICKSLMELHGGELTVASKPNEGTTFTAVFPAHRAGARQEAVNA
ncbi:MAG TPA: ATP-binding protein [Rhizomicrobium sp.]